jgi:hypothetical protein
MNSWGKTDGDKSEVDGGGVGEQGLRDSSADGPLNWQERQKYGQLDRPISKSFLIFASKSEVRIWRLMISHLAATFGCDPLFLIPTLRQHAKINGGCYSACLHR